MTVLNNTEIENRSNFLEAVASENYVDIFAAYKNSYYIKEADDIKPYHFIIKNKNRNGGRGGVDEVW